VLIGDFKTGAGIGRISGLLFKWARLI